MRPGLRDELITEAIKADLAALNNQAARRQPLDPAEAATRLTRYLSTVVERLLKSPATADGPDQQAELINSLITQLGSDDQIAIPPELLLGILNTQQPGLATPPELPNRPEIPLSMSDLLFNGAGQPTLGSELRAELDSALRVDLICAFVIWSRRG